MTVSECLLAFLSVMKAFEQESEAAKTMPYPDARMIHNSTNQVHEPVNFVSGLGNNFFRYWSFENILSQALKIHVDIFADSDMGFFALPLMSGISPHQLEDDDDDDTHRSRLVSRNGISQISALRFSFIGDIYGSISPGRTNMRRRALIDRV
ncbi:hypothetical protein PABG_03897 [Paracoccidioides brasiliensis Pb03]|nr:hypothetical protein PABG_03897 [Paracoccidioides brasiliensis Pb03]